ncbi:MAG: hypothetical protein AAGG01_19280 [Planctomycetota bacterium]
MLNLIAPAALTCALFVAPQAERPAEFRKGPPGMSAEMIDRILTSRMEEHIRYAIYTPVHLSSIDLAEYAARLAPNKVHFHALTADGYMKEHSRDRFVQLRDSVGVQDFPGGLEAGLAILKDLDTKLGRELGSRMPEQIVVTHELSRLTPSGATKLLRTTFPGLMVTEIQESSVLTLKGSKADIEAARAILEETDRPYPQVLLNWTLYEATESAGNDAAPAEIAAALAPVVPGMEFRRAGAFIVRGPAGGDAALRVSSGLKGLGGMSDDLPSEISLTAIAKSWDADTQTLHLDRCEVSLQRSRFVESDPATGGTSRSTMVSTDQLSTELSLKAGETTIVGSMGGDPVFVALTLTVL